MKRKLMMKGAKKLVRELAGVQSGENVLIVTDTNKIGIAEVVASDARERGAEVVMATMKPREIHGQDPPKTISEAMKKADVIFAPTTFSISATVAFNEACKNGARGLSMPAWTEEMLFEGGINADFLGIRPMVEKLAGHLREATTATVTSSAGTEIRADLWKGMVEASHGIARDPGVKMFPPIIEAAAHPALGSGEGTLVVDGSIALPELGPIEEPVTLTVKKGRIIKIKGKREAEVFKGILDGLNDSNVYILSEVAVGLNPECRLSGNFAEDEGVYGTIHFGFGWTHTLESSHRSKAHIDVVILNPTLSLDSKVVLKDGELTL